MERFNTAFAERVRDTLAPPEVRRIAESVDRMLIDAVLNTMANIPLPGHLITTDRTLQRWAAAPTGVPAQNPDVYRESRPPPLDPRTQEAVSDVLKASSKGVQCFCADWYLCTAWLSQDEMARQRQMTRRQLVREWHDILFLLREQFLASPHTDLVNLIRQSP
jgi:hypothetical protein